MVTPETLYDLTYFEEIFGGRTDEFREILGILITMLEKYQEEYPPIIQAGDVELLAQFRHKNVTLTANLHLDRLKELSLVVVGLTDPVARQHNINESLLLVRQVIEGLRHEP